MYRISAIYKAGTGTRFDKEYYLSHHVPLAFQQLNGRVNIRRVEVEWDLSEVDWSTQTKPDEEKIISPCRFSVLVDTEEDLQDFFEFMRSPARDPVHGDVQNYTDCEMSWVVSEVLEQTGG